MVFNKKKTVFIKRKWNHVVFSRVTILSFHPVYQLQVNISHLFAVCSIWPLDRTLSGATTPGQSGPGSNANEVVHHIPLSSSITGASPSDGLMSYPGHLLGGGSYLSAEMQSVYSTNQADWAGYERNLKFLTYKLVTEWAFGCKIIALNR